MIPLITIRNGIWPQKCLAILTYWDEGYLAKGLFTLSAACCMCVYTCNWAHWKQWWHSNTRTQQCASFDVPITLLVTGVLRLLVHVYGTRCQHIYASVIVSDNLNGCSRLICLVLETATLCGIFVRSAVYKSSYLLIHTMDRCACACLTWISSILLMCLIHLVYPCISTLTSVHRHIIRMVFNPDSLREWSLNECACICVYYHYWLGIGNDMTHEICQSRTRHLSVTMC